MDANYLVILHLYKEFSMKIYPLLFEPNLHTVVWGGERLCPYKGLLQSSEPVGESWEVSAVPSSPSIIANGAYAGRDLISVVSEHPEGILGKAVCEKYHGQLPLLVKFIDAKRDLSIQVHPDDAMAQRVHGKMGKSEMWYIIDAQPGSFLYAGFKKEITPEEYKQRIADGSIVEVLARHEVHAGDVFYLPAGRVHAIGSGILLAATRVAHRIGSRGLELPCGGRVSHPLFLCSEQSQPHCQLTLFQRARHAYGKTLPSQPAEIRQFCDNHVHLRRLRTTFSPVGRKAVTQRRS